MKVAKTHEKISNQRRDFLHKKSRYYVDNNDIIFAEDLNIVGMIKDSPSGRRYAISDSGWYTFLNYIHYKAEGAGNVFRKVPPRNTSQRCSGCREIVEKTLAIRTHRCPFCGLEIDRDYNASINIKKLGISMLLEELQEVTLGEIGPLENSEGILQVRSQNQEAHDLSHG